MKPPEYIETERLILRKPSIEESHIIIERCLKLWDSESDYPFVLPLKESVTPIGMLALHPENFMIGLGYVLAKDYWGKGYMTQAVREITNWLLEQSDVYRVFAVCDVENPASARVMEKAGMIREGLLRRYTMHPNVSDEPRDCYMYAIVK